MHFKIKLLRTELKINNIHKISKAVLLSGSTSEVQLDSVV